MGKSIFLSLPLLSSIFTQAQSNTIWAGMVSGGMILSRQRHAAGDLNLDFGRLPPGFCLLEFIQGKGNPVFLKIMKTAG